MSDLLKSLTSASAAATLAGAGPGSAVPSALASAANLPAALANLAAGNVIAGVVIERGRAGIVLLKTDKGVLQLQTNLPLKPGDDKGPFALGYTAEGKLKSFFAGKPFPNEKGEKVTLPANTSLPADAEKPLDEAQAPARILLMGSSNVVSDMYVAGVSRYVPVYQIDLAFALNVMDWLAQDKALSSIRAKAITQRPITYASESTPLVLEAVNIVGVPLLFILFGVARWRIRYARRQHAKI